MHHASSPHRRSPERPQCTQGEIPRGPCDPIGSHSQNFRSPARELLAEDVGNLARQQLRMTDNQERFARARLKWSEKALIYEPFDFLSFKKLSKRLSAHNEGCQRL